MVLLFRTDFTGSAIIQAFKYSVYISVTAVKVAAAKEGFRTWYQNVSVNLKEKVVLEHRLFQER